MSLLVLALPPDAPGPCDWVRSAHGQSADEHGQAAADLLPRPGRGGECVAVVPASRLSWHRVELPRGVGPRTPRLRAILGGLLEEQLLQPPETLHFALGPDSSRPGGSTWVAACDRDWLQQHLDALEAAGLNVDRIVPQLHPADDSLHIRVSGSAETPWLLASGQALPSQPLALPFSPASAELLRLQLQAGDIESALLQAEPAVVEQVEQWLSPWLQLAPQLQTPAQALLQASRSPWDLAQLELSRSTGASARRQLASGWRSLWHAPQWRPLRWGMVALLLVQVLGLNLWAHQTRQELSRTQSRIQAVLTDTFPQVQVVVDAPIQMERELALLRQRTGSSTRDDLEPLLAALAQLPELQAETVGNLEYSPGRLVLRGLELDAQALLSAQVRLRPLGLRLDSQDQALSLQAGGQP